MRVCGRGWCLEGGHQENQSPAIRAGKVAQWIRAPAALVKDPGSVPSTHAG